MAIAGPKARASLQKIVDRIALDDTASHTWRPRKSAFSAA
jgi:hypothetical protein